MSIRPTTVTAPPLPVIAHTAGLMLQRNCDCGQHTVAGGACDSCNKNADVNLWSSAFSDDFSAFHDNGVPSIVHDVLRSPGQSLDFETRSFMEERFAHDFSRVRLRADGQAAESARAVNAHAYTVGQNVVFGAGQYRPNTLEGKGLIAHELTHVVQQDRAGAIELNREGINEAEQTVKELEARHKQKMAIVERAKWGAAEPKKERGWDLYPTNKPLPIYRIVIHHTADPLNQTVKELQNKEMEAGYADMPYHFIITADGAVSEGRKLEVVGAHAGEIAGNKDITKDPDYGSIGIVLTGDFESRKENLFRPDKPTIAQLVSMTKLVNQLIREYDISPTNILKHSEVKRSGKPKVCPGEFLAPHVDALRSGLVTTRAKEADAYKTYFSALQALSMNDLLKRLTQFGSQESVEGLLKRYAPYSKDFGARPQLAMRAAIIYLKGAQATQAERDALLAESAKEFPGEKQDQHKAIVNLVIPPVKGPKKKIQKASLGVSSPEDPCEREAHAVAHQVIRAEQERSTKVARVSNLVRPFTPLMNRSPVAKWIGINPGSAAPAGTIQRSVDDPQRFQQIHQSLFVGAPGGGGTALQPWVDPSPGVQGTAEILFRQAKSNIQQHVTQDPASIGGTISTQMTETALDADAVDINQRIRARFPMINVTVSDAQIRSAVNVMTPALTSSTDYLREWLANKMPDWSDRENFNISETDPRFVALLDRLLADPDVGSALRIMASRQSGFQRGQGLTREIFLHRGTDPQVRPAILFHELTHFYAHPAYLDWVATTTNERWYNEGFTEYLARLAMPAAMLAGRVRYGDRVNSINTQVAAHVPETDIARAYFLGEVWRIETRSTIPRREAGAQLGLSATATAREEQDASRTGPGINQTVVPGRRYRFMNIGFDQATPKPEHVSFFRAVRTRHLDPAPTLGVIFEGHASSAGALDYNQRLSLRRARAFYQMARQEGLAPNRLINANNPPHFGETRPTAQEEDPVTRAFNRRVEMEIQTISP